MALTFYYGSGSPFAWKVWLTLEHKRIGYDFRLLSFDRGDLKTPEFRAVNPRGQVPAIVDDGFALWESMAIVEYLEVRYPQQPLLPQDAARIAEGQGILLKELARWDVLLTGDYLAGPLSLADFTAYPYLRLVCRIGERQPKNDLGDRMPPRLRAWMQRIEALPYYAKTIPPHWKS